MRYFRCQSVWRFPEPSLINFNINSILTETRSYFLVFWFVYICARFLNRLLQIFIDRHDEGEYMPPRDFLSPSILKLNILTALIIARGKDGGHFTRKCNWLHGNKRSGNKAYCDQYNLLNSDN